MPTIAFTSAVPVSTGNIALTLFVIHEIVVGHPSPSPLHIKRPLLNEIDISLDSAFSISLAGTVNGVDVSDEDILDSAPMVRLLAYLNLHAQDLGFARAYIQVVGHSPRIYLDATEKRSARGSNDVSLKGLQLQCAFKVSNSDLYPFSSSPFASFEEVYNQALGKFVTSQMTKQYPCVFGGTLTYDDTMHSCIAHSLARMMARAEDTIEGVYKTSIKEMRRELKTRSKVQTQAVRDMLDALPLTEAPMEYSAASVPRDTTTIITQSLGMFAKHGRRVPLSKTMKNHNSAHIEDAQCLLFDDGQESQTARGVIDFDTLLTTDILTSDDQHVTSDVLQSRRTPFIDCAVDKNFDITSSFFGIPFHPSMLNESVFSTLCNSEDNPVFYNESTMSDEDVGSIYYLFDQNDEECLSSSFIHDDQLSVQVTSACHGFDRREAKKVHLHVFRRFEEFRALLTSVHLTCKAAYRDEFTDHQESYAPQFDGSLSDGDSDFLSNFSDDISGQPILDTCEEWGKLPCHPNDLRELSQVDCLCNGTNHTFLGSKYHNAGRIDEFDPSMDEILDIGF